MANFESKQFGKYTLLEKLAVGGMAEIYKAKTFGAEGFEKLLAIKKILGHAAADKEFIDMLIDEAKLSVLLSHANIVQVYDLGKVGDDYFISMEYIHGVNMRDILYRLREKNKKMPIELAVYVVSEVCKGLDYAHRKTDSNNQALGIVHRDISPQNILISYEGEVKIVDFGIAKAAMNISHTMAGILKGKIAYMSPEQAMGKAVDHKTDLFSLGILFFEALTGKKLYTGESQFEVLKKIRTTRIDTAKLPDSIPEILKPIVAKALAYRPEDRYNSASDMQVALTKYLYATFTDFSPRKLATFVKDLFREEATLDKKEAEGVKELQIQTGSVSLSQPQGTLPTQQEIVHREITPAVAKKSKEGTGSRSVTVSELGVRRKKHFPTATLVGIAAVAFAAIGLAGWHFLKKPIAFGTLQVASEPEGSTILLNGKRTDLQTPAILENLELNKKWTVAVEHPEYGSKEETVLLKNTEPKKLNFDLSKNLGMLNVISDPAGAAILVNSIAWAQVTPASVEGLVLNKEYKITLTKPGYQDVEQPVTLASTAPQKLLATLKPIEQIASKEPVAPLPQPPAPTPPLLPQPSMEEEDLGKIDIRTNPQGAKIFLNGKDTGKRTPSTLSDLKKGRYTLRLLKENFQPIIRSVTIASAKSYPVEERLLELKKPEEKKPSEEKPAKKEEPAPSPPPPTAGGEGNIKITSSPSGADVFINGEKQGTTPLTVRVRAGNVKVLVTKEGDRIPCRQVVSLQTGATANIDCSLGNLFGRVDVNSNPPRAEVYFDGKKLNGKTPLTIEKVKRDKGHTIRLEMEGFKAWERSFDLDEKETKAFNVELER